MMIHSNPNFSTTQRQLFSAMSMGTLEDLGYKVNVDEADAFGLDDLVASGCAQFCPQATGERRLGQSASPLSPATEQRILSAVPQRLGRKPFSLTDEMDALVKAGTIPPPSHAVGVTLEENGQYYNRIVHCHESEYWA